MDLPKSEDLNDYKKIMAQMFFTVWHSRFGAQTQLLILGIRKQDISDFQLNESRALVKWSGFQTPFNIRTKMSVCGICHRYIDCSRSIPVLIYVTERNCNFGKEDCLALNCTLKYCRIPQEKKTKSFYSFQVSYLFRGNFYKLKTFFTWNIIRF